MTACGAWIELFTALPHALFRKDRLPWHDGGLPTAFRTPLKKKGGSSPAEIKNNNLKIKNKNNENNACQKGL